MAVKLAHASMIVHGLLTQFAEKRNFETKQVEGYRATLLGANGGAVVVNFAETDAVPFAPNMTQVVWEVIPGEYDVEGNRGMSVRFVRVVDEADLLALGEVVRQLAEAYPDKTTAEVKS